MCVYCRYILIALLALPQGMCCVATGCKTREKRVAGESNPSSECCSCCRGKPDGQPSAKLSNHSDASKCAPAKSCECKCRFQLGIPREPVTLDALSSLHSSFDRPFEINSPAVETSVAISIVPRSIRLQILYCVWRC